MNVNQLMTWVDELESHHKIVGDYDGSYALGVTDNPPAFLLRVGEFGVCTPWRLATRRKREEWAGSEQFIFRPGS